MGRHDSGRLDEPDRWLGVESSRQFDLGKDRRLPTMRARDEGDSPSRHRIRIGSQGLERNPFRSRPVQLRRGSSWPSVGLERAWFPMGLWCPRKR